MSLRPLSFVVGLVALIGLVTWGQVTPAFAQPPARGGEVLDVSARVEVLRSRLGLTPEQATTVRTILEDARREVQSLRADASAAGHGRGEVDDLRERRRAILYRVEDRIWAILGCAQKDAFRLYIREQLEERAESHRGFHHRRGPR